jgi:hypothetical protein
MRQRLQSIRIRERLPIWGLRLLLAIILLTFSELVMWQNPPARNILEWPILLLLYLPLAAILMDLVVRFQANDPPSLLLVSGVYGLGAATIINHSAFSPDLQTLFSENLIYNLVVRAMALQTGAGLYGLLLFVVVMRGKQVEPLHIIGAAAIGILWGIWVHWYPIRTAANWGLVRIETAHLYILAALGIIGVLVFAVAPRFRFIREEQMQLLWWERGIVGVPLFIALVVGMIQEVIPFLQLLLVIGIIAYMIWALSNQLRDYDPSVLAEMLFAAPNAVSFIILAVVFLVAGTLAYTLVDGPDSPIGLGAYLVALAFGAAWLPGASLLIFWRASRAQPVKKDGNK